MDDLLNYSQMASWLEINADAFRNNIQVFRNALKNQSKLGVVLKGNAYGHGLEVTMPIVHPLVDCIYVIAPQDAFQIRKLEKTHSLAKKQILVMGAISCDEAIACAQHDIDVVVADEHWRTYLSEFRKAGVKIKAHIHLDTGLSREGFSFQTVEKNIEFLKGSQDVMSIEGVMSHFANTEDVTVQQFALAQVKGFQEGLEKLEASFASGIPGRMPLQKHIAATTAALILPQSRQDIVRVGIGLYGLWASAEAKVSAQWVLNGNAKLEPALTWKCKSTIVKMIKKGSYVGYGCTYRCQYDTRIAVLPVGYFDGYSRHATGKAHVLVNKQRCPVIGRIMMNHAVIDITSATTDQDREIEAILLGADGDETITADMFAGWAQTISYEVVTRLGSHLKRTVV